MVIADHDSYTGRLESGHGFFIGCPAVHSDEKTDSIVDCPIDRPRRDAISIFPAVGYKTKCVRHKRVQILEEECGTANSIDVIVAMNQDPVLCLDRLPNRRHGQFHMLEENGDPEFCGCRYVVAASMVSNERAARKRAAAAGMSKCWQSKRTVPGSIEPFSFQMYLFKGGTTPPRPRIVLSERRDLLQGYRGNGQFQAKSSRP